MNFHDKQGYDIDSIKVVFILEDVFLSKVEIFSLDAYFKFVPDKVGESAPATSCHKSSCDDQSVSCDMSKVNNLSN